MAREAWPEGMRRWIAEKERAAEKTRIEFTAGDDAWAEWLYAQVLASSVTADGDENAAARALGPDREQVAERARPGPALHRPAVASVR